MSQGSATASTADAVVIGAGVIGCSVALELARDGRSVVVVDKAPGPGQGSTSASSAIVRFNYSTFAGVATAWEAYHCWRDWSGHLEDRTGAPLAAFHRTGMVMLDVPIAPAAHVLGLLDAVGVRYEVWDAAELRRRVPGIDTGAYWPNKRVDDDAFWVPATHELGAFYTPDAGFVDDPQLAAVNLAAAAERAGARFRYRQQVTQVLSAGDRVKGVRLADGTLLSSAVVVNVGGPWSAGLNALAGVGSGWSVATRAMRQEVHQVPAPQGFNGADRLGPVVADLDLGTYMRATFGDGVLVGGTEPACDGYTWVDDPDLVNPNPTVPVFTAQLTRAARRFPGLQVPGSPRGVAGLYDVTADWTPVYDRTELAGYYVAIGTSGNQFKNAPVVGRLMASLVDAVESGHDHDADPVSHRAEHTGQLIDLGTFSRLRSRNSESSGTVIG